MWVKWDQPGERRYETGIDRGVLYLSDAGQAFPWNGLTAVTESVTVDSSPIYFDGRKTNNSFGFGEFSGKLQAFTYPEILETLQGVANVHPGTFIDGQMPQYFHLSYRTKVGNDLTENESYKITVLYNILATPSETTYSSAGEDVSPVDFSWDISTIPEDIPNRRPSSRLIINTKDISPTKLQQVEELLYGTNTVPPLLPGIAFMVYFMGLP